MIFGAWRNQYGPKRPIRVSWYANIFDMEDEMNEIALTPGNRWSCDPPFYSDKHYVVVYTYAPQTS